MNMSSTALRPNNNNNNNNNSNSRNQFSHSLPRIITPNNNNNTNSSPPSSSTVTSAASSSSVPTPPTTPTTSHQMINTTPTNTQQQTQQQQHIINMCNSGKYKPNPALIPHIVSLLTNFQEALKKKAQGQSELYDKMNQNFNKLPPSQLILAFKALSLCAGLLTPEHHQSFIAILLHQSEEAIYFQRDTDIVHSYIDFLSAMFTYCPTYFSSFLGFCVNMLKPMDLLRFQQFKAMVMSSQIATTGSVASMTYGGGASSSSSTQQQQQQQQQIQALRPEVLQQLEELKFHNVQLVLQHLSVGRHATLFQKSIIALLGDHYPHHYNPLRFHKYYVLNLLQLSQYLPDRFFSQIFRLIIDRMIAMDAEIKPGLEDATTTATATTQNNNNTAMMMMINNEESSQQQQQQNSTANMTSAQLLFDMELDASLMDPSADEHLLQVYMAEKLDTVMLILFEYIHACSTNPTKIQRVFDTMMQMFSSFVANTYQLHSLQFLMFYICSFNVKFVHRFIQYLLTKVLDKSQNVDVRKCCAAYISGFVSRANYMTAESVVEALERQVIWLEQYIQMFEKTVTSTFLDIHTHAIFYSVCQGVFYVLCYKIYPLMQSEQGRQFLHNSVFEKIVYSRFNPFKIIAMDVVQEVVSAFRHYSLHDFTQLLINNRDLVVVKSKSTVNYLENNFFPFDPYLLRQSQSFINPLYQKWEGGYDLSYNNLYNNPPSRSRSRSIRSTTSLSSSDDGMYDEDGAEAFSYEDNLVGSNHYNSSMDRAGLFFQASESTSTSTTKQQPSKKTTSSLRKRQMLDDDDDDDEEEEESVEDEKIDDDDDDVNFDDDDDDEDENLEEDDNDVFSSDEGENDLHYHEDDDVEIGSYNDSNRFIMIPGVNKSRKNSSVMRRSSFMGSPASFDEMQHPYGWPNM